MVPDDLWTRFQRVVPPLPVRPQGGGHRRRGNRETRAAITLVVMSGCTGNQLPSGFGSSGVTAFRRFTQRKSTASSTAGAGSVCRPLRGRRACRPGPHPAGSRHPAHPVPTRPRDRRPGKLHGGEGHDYRHLRRWSLPTDPAPPGPQGRRGGPPGTSGPASSLTPCRTRRPRARAEPLRQVRAVLSGTREGGCIRGAT